MIRVRQREICAPEYWADLSRKLEQILPVAILGTNASHREKVAWRDHWRTSIEPYFSLLSSSLEMSWIDFMHLLCFLSKRMMAVTVQLTLHWPNHICTFPFRRSIPNGTRSSSSEWVFNYLLDSLSPITRICYSLYVKLLMNCSVTDKSIWLN